MWFLGSDLYWREFGAAAPVYSGEDSIVDAKFSLALTRQTVTVDGSDSVAVGATITGYEWDFGDGTTDTGATATHTYTQAGQYTVALTVTDSANHSDTAMQVVSITKPVAVFSWNATGTTATFDATASTNAATYGWDFGDGATATGVTASHAYASAGTRTVTLTVTDASGNTDTDVQAVSVALPVSNPIAAFTSSVSNLVATFDASSSSTTNATITGYAWTFGDGTTGTGVHPSHTYTVGSYTATLTITDSQGRTNSVSHGVTITAPANQPPTAAFTSTPNGLTVTYSAVTSTDGDGTIASYAWTFGDGGTGTGVSPQHTYAAAGSYTTRLTVTDNLGAQGTTTKTVTVSQPNPGGTTVLASTSTSTSSKLTPASTAAVIQQFIRSPDTGEFYSTQRTFEPDGVTESVRVSRMLPSGAFIDTMRLTAAGHGSTFALEYSGGQVYVWLNWQKAVDGVTDTYDLVRFPYKAGTFTRSQVTGLTVKVTGPTYRLAGFDWQGGHAVIQTITSTSSTYTRYPLTNVLAGNLTGSTGQFTVPANPPTVQGFATYQSSLFRYTGVPASDASFPDNPPTLTEYSWATAAVIRTLDLTSYLGGGEGEPEGLSVYDTGSNPVLFFGISAGPVGGPHTYPTWWYPLVDPTTGGQPTGAGITRYQDLTGSTFNAKITSAPTANMVSFPSGTFEFQNFAVSTNYGAVYSGHGLLGSGPADTVIRMTAGSSTKAGSVPTASGTTNPLYLLRLQGTASGNRYEGFHLQGTTQGHNYHGMKIASQPSPIVKNVKVSAVPGSSAINPGETFHIDYNGVSNLTASNVVIDGGNVGASGWGANGSSGGTLTDCTAQNLKYCKGWAGWKHTGGATFTRFVASNNAFAFGFEQCSGTYTLNGCTFGTATRADIHLAHNADIAGKATVVINDPVLPSGKTQIKVLLSTNELGKPNTQTRSDIKVFVGGVDKSSTMLTFVTSA